MGRCWAVMSALKARPSIHAASNPRQKLYGCCDENYLVFGKIAGVRGGQCMCSNLKCKGRNGIL